MSWHAWANEALILVKFLQLLKIVVYFTILLPDIFFSYAVTLRRNIAPNNFTGCHDGTNLCSSDHLSLGPSYIIVTSSVLGLPRLSIFMYPLLLNSYTKLLPLKLSLTYLYIKLHLWIPPPDQPLSRIVESLI